MKKYSYIFVKQSYFNESIELLSKEYKNNKQKLELKCLKCNCIWFSCFSCFKNDNQGCPRCVQCEKYSYDFVRYFLLERFIKLISKEYINNKCKLKLECLKCNHLWFARFDNLKGRNSGCPICAKEKRENTWIKNYGVNHPSKSKQISIKQAKSQNNSIILYHWKTGEELICQASYERKVVEYLNQNKIDFDWQIRFDMPNGKKYFVDLHLKEQNKYAEIKGYFRKDAKEKWEWFHKEYLNSELWNKDKLKEMGIL